MAETESGAPPTTLQRLIQKSTQPQIHIIIASGCFVIGLLFGSLLALLAGILLFTFSAIRLASKGLLKYKKRSKNSDEENGEE